MCCGTIMIRLWEQSTDVNPTISEKPHMQRCHAKPKGSICFLYYMTSKQILYFAEQTI